MLRKNVDSRQKQIPTNNKKMCNYYYVQNYEMQPQEKNKRWSVWIPKYDLTLQKVHLNPV